MKDYLALWAEWPKQESILLDKPISVVGERRKHSASRAEFARVRLTAHPARAFEVTDNVAEKSVLEKLGAGWPDCVILGLLDMLMLAEPGPLYKIRVVLEEVWYHDVDSSWQAFRHAGRDAGRKIIDAIDDR